MASKKYKFCPESFPTKPVVSRTPSGRTSKKFSFLKLPQNVFTIIFQHLSSVDRKRFRLVSRECFYTCWAFEDAEKLCIRTEYNSLTNRALSILLKSNRQILHLELEQLDFGWSPLWEQLWIVFGLKIRSLKLRSRRPQFLSKDFCLGWIKECSRLESVQIYVEHLEDTTGLIHAAQHLKEFCFENRSPLKFEVFLTDLKSPVGWSSRRTWWTLQDVLSDVFPKVRNFPLCQHDPSFEDEPFQKFEEKRTRLGDMWSRRQEIFLAKSAITRRDRPLDERPDSMFFNVLCFMDVSPNFLVGKESTNSTEDLIISCDGEKPLRSVSPIFRTAVERSAPNFVQHCDVKLLRVDMSLRFQKLKSLRISLSVGAVYWDSDWIEKIFVKTDIASIHVVCKELKFRRRIFSFSTCPKVTSFTLDTQESYIHREFCVIKILEAFPKLKNLHLSFVNEKILQFICETLSELESLTIGKMMTRGFLEKPTYNSFNLDNLKRLKRLEIPQNLKIIGKPFANLTCLLVTGMHGVEEYQFDLKPYLDLSASLEVAWFDRFVLPAGDRDLLVQRIFLKRIVNDFLRRHPRLKLLYLKCYSTSGQPHVCELNLNAPHVHLTFRAHPSLQILVHNKVFVKNAVLNSVQMFDNDFLRDHELMLRFPHILRPT